MFIKYAAAHLQQIGSKKIEEKAITAPETAKDEEKQKKVWIFFSDEMF